MNDETQTTSAAQGRLTTHGLANATRSNAPAVKRPFSTSLSLTIEAESMEEADRLLGDALDQPWLMVAGWTTWGVEDDA